MTLPERPPLKIDRARILEHLKNASSFDRFLYAMIVVFLLVMVVSFIGQQIAHQNMPQHFLKPRPTAQSSTDKTPVEQAGAGSTSDTPKQEPNKSDARQR